MKQAWAIVRAAGGAARRQAPRVSPGRTDEHCRAYTGAMSASEIQAFSAIAFQFAAALQAYEEDMDLLVEEGLQPGRYQRVSVRMDEMRLYASSLPVLSVAWVEVLIRHFELTHCLFHAHQQPQGTGAASQLHGQWRQAVQRLSRKCLQLLPSA
jgi:hypothetical protein